MTIPFVLEKFKIAFAILGCYVYMRLLLLTLSTVNQEHIQFVYESRHVISNNVTF